ncbi:hypothetical protein [Tepidimicrobium xylanilyticum]|uniref:Uncharacterized protein n=1 Tax=Tepidimicrobium xylanilyticum TaxID=1123352 RepID=A0A1H3EJH6_9FIRM|nr:hypothetical protein [Tepidimicrobium xylanilyticum]GMG96252.1 hypothetical protein EN5CB1_10780 [Tepidimicrobium xylanilyticum]SDX78770.1 hypothetical protein SAMN05660923_02933 [Tepidimicrobium xylanilyticum]
MYENGLIHRVDIYPMEKNTSNRTQKNQMRAKESVIEDVICRIVKDEKIMFEADVILKTGDIIKDKYTGKEYMVEDEYIATGFNVHHRSYKVKKKVI